MNSKPSLTNRVLVHGVLLFALAVFMFPVLWMFLTSFKDSNTEFNRFPPILFPAEWKVSNYTDALTDKGGLRAFGDSLVIATSTAVICTFFGAMTAYSLARFRTGGQDFAFWILSTRMFPPVASALPLFLIFRELRLLDTYGVLIVANTVFNLPFATWLLKGFIEDLPAELEESARVDGCSYFRAFVQITLPLITPGLVVTALFSFIFTWNEFMFALLLTRNKVQPITTVLPTLVGGHETLWGQIAALGMIAIIPGTLLALFLQRYIVRGLTMGAVKG